MLDRKDQQLLERHLEKRDTALHRTLSMIIVAVGAFMMSGALNNIYGHIAMILVASLSAGYTSILIYHVVVTHKSARLLKQQAKRNESVFVEELDEYLEHVRKLS